jgi:diguanylate cyclase (GGDEF)-like protein/PAS domain S-box-containing protein
MTLEIQSSRKLEALHRIYELSYTDESSFAQAIIDEIIDLLEAGIGYLHFVDEDEETLQLVAWSSEVHKFCTAAYNNHYPVSRAGIWADCIRYRRTVIHNHYPIMKEKQGLPKGHFPVLNHMSTPIFHKDRVVAVVGVGNRDGGFAPGDAQELESFAALLWLLLEQKRVINEHESQRLRLEAALTAAQAGRFDYHVFDNEIRLDHHGQTMFGFENNVLALDEWREIVCSEDQKPLFASFKRFASDTEKFEYEVFYRICRKDQSIRYIRSVGYIMRNSEGKAVWITGLNFDITEEYRRDLGQRRAAAVFENAITGILVTDASLKIVDVNKAMVTLSGYSEEEILGQTPALFRSGFHNSEYYQEMWEGLEKKDFWAGEFWNRRKDGEIFVQESYISVIRDTKGNVSGYINVCADITAQKEALSQLDYLAYHDELTGLPNRTYLQQFLNDEMELHSKQGRKLGLLFIDLDHFKYVNDSMGHAAGDLLLQRVSARLQSCLRDSDFLARHGGDEFVVVIRSLLVRPLLTRLCERLIEANKQPYKIMGEEVYIGCSIGISLFPHDARNSEELISNADAAMYEAKAQGRNTCRFYEAPLTQKAREHLELARGFRYALEKREFVLHFQPQLDLKQNKVVSCEVLVRWDHPQHGLIPPGRFIPFAEDSELIVELERWIFDETCRVTAPWIKAGLLQRVAINLSRRHLVHNKLEGTLNQALKVHGLEPESLELEVTETLLMSSGEEGKSVLRRLRQRGFHIAIDDFGTGYSSLSTLNQLPFTCLKIDRSFLSDIPANNDNVALIRLILGMGETLGMEVVAEGIETEEQRLFLQQNGCPLGQGFLFSPGLPAEEFAVYLQQASSSPS